MIQSRHFFSRLLPAMLCAAACVAQTSRTAPATVAVVNPVFRSELRPWLSLDGDWSYVLDPDENIREYQILKGEVSSWSTIHVPGTWGGAGHRPDPAEPPEAYRASM